MSLKKNNIFIILITLSMVSCAPPPGSDGSFLASVGPFLPFGLIIILFYFLIIRPQNKQQRERDNMLKALKKGDNVITNGGIIGKVVDVLEKDVLVVEISKGVQIKVKREFINSLILDEK
tara:strand:+ start:264 stop:623 length:360 start_codon:yes stop_codon:yes gene_type:complete